MTGDASKRYCSQADLRWRAQRLQLPAPKICALRSRQPTRFVHRGGRGAHDHGCPPPSGAMVDGRPDARMDGVSMNDKQAWEEQEAEAELDWMGEGARRDLLRTEEDD